MGPFPALFQGSPTLDLVPQYVFSGRLPLSVPKVRAPSQPTTQDPTTSAARCGMIEAGTPAEAHQPVHGIHRPAVGMNIARDCIQPGVTSPRAASTIVTRTPTPAIRCRADPARPSEPAVMLRHQLGPFARSPTVVIVLAAWGAFNASLAILLGNLAATRSTATRTSYGTGSVCRY